MPVTTGGDSEARGAADAPVARGRGGTFGVIKWVVLVAAGALFVQALRSADLTRSWAEIRGVGPAMLLVLAPYLVAVTVDVLGWRLVLRALGRTVRLAPLLHVRLAVEAVLMSLPGGALIAESMNPYLLRERAGVPLQEGFASIGVKKGLFSLAHGLYIVFGAVVGFATLRAISPAVIGGRSLPWLIVGSGVFAILASLAVLVFLLSGTFATRAHALLAGLPGKRLRAFFDERREGFEGADRHFQRLLAKERPRLLGAVLCFLLSWFTESFETWLILHLLAVDLSLTSIISFEAAVSLLRSLAFFVPSGLGVQDISYMAFLRAFPIADPASTGAAFVLLKRAKEVVWIAFGYLLLIVSGERPTRLGLRPEPR